MANFPTSLDNVANDVDDVDASFINTLQDKVGADSSAVTTSHDYKLSGVTGSDKAVSKTGTETLTNKTLTSPTINLGSDATGDIYYRDSGGNFVRLGISSANEVLRVGAGGVPEWVAILDEDNMSSDSATRVASQQSIKAYVDNNVTVQIKMADFTYAMSTATGTQAITGVGFQPDYVYFTAGVVGGKGRSFGYDDGTAENAHEYRPDTEVLTNRTGWSIYLQETAGSDLQTARIQSMDADGFTLTWTKTGSPTSTALITYQAFKA